MKAGPLAASMAEPKVGPSVVSKVGRLAERSVALKVVDLALCSVESLVVVLDVEKVDSWECARADEMAGPLGAALVDP